MPVSAGTAVQPIPPFVADEQKHRRAISVWMQRAHVGGLGNTGNVTLTAGATSTTVADVRAHAYSFIGLAPVTANAASAQAAGNVYISTRTDAQFIIAHPNSAAVDQTFVYCLLG